MSTGLVSPSAVTLLNQRMTEGSRVLVLGAGGWFGSTILTMIAESCRGTEVLGLTGTPRRLRVGEQKWALGAWDWDVVARFAPSLVVNCAFLTREKLDQVGYQRYVAENVVLTSRFLRTLALPSVTAAVTISSGAAVSPTGDAPSAEHNPYGHLKWVEEILSREEADVRSVALVVCRAWSVSGPLVIRPPDYAFSDLITQAAAGRAQIHAPHEVWRRYVGVDDLLAVCISLAEAGWSGDVDSGGTLVELGELAAEVIADVQPGLELVRADSDGSPSDNYHSDDVAWGRACERLGFTPATLKEQIRITAAGLRARPS